MSPPTWSRRCCKLLALCSSRYEEARRLLTSNAGDPAGPGPAAPVPAPVGLAPRAGLTEHRRFTLAGLTAIIEGAGLRAGDAHGVRISRRAAAGGGRADPATADALRDLEGGGGRLPGALVRDIAARLHIFGHR